MKILVTGGAGYLGSTLVPALLAMRHDVTVLDSFMWGEASLSAVCADPKLEIVRGDARNLETLQDAGLRSADVIIPLAALVGAPLCASDPIGATSTNRDAIATLCRAAGVGQRIIIPISNSGYGIGEPGKECTEKSPLRPVSLYGKLKVQAEEIAMTRRNSTSLRLATVFGMSPRMRLDLLVNDFVYRAATDRAIVLFEPHFKRNYIHVRDVATAFLLAVHDHAMTGEVYNVGLSSANLSKMELCEEIKKHVPGFAVMVSAIGEDPDKRDYIVSNEKIEAAGWFPEMGLDAGIVELLKGYRMLRNARYGNA